MNDQTPIPTGYDIYWERWEDAYDSDDIKQEMDSLDEEYIEDIEDNEYFDELELKPFTMPIQTIMTPFGVLPLTERSLASKHFKFWVGHCNFKLFDGYYPIIESCEGVESVDILTPYRFRLGVAKLFQDRDVMHQVKKVLLSTVKHEYKNDQ